MRFSTFCFLAYLVQFSACYSDETCENAYIGVFKIDSSLVKDRLQRNYIYRNRWDTIKLTSKANGNYAFNVNDNLLNQSLGKWFTQSNNIEGNCSGYIKQLNLPYAFIRDPFDIMIIVDTNVRFSLPFRKLK